MPLLIKSPVVAAVAVAMAVALVGCPSAETQTQSPAKEPSSAAKGASTKPTTSGPSCDPKVGAVAPKLTIDAINTGSHVSINPGKVTLVDFWATWCGPCRESFPKYQELYTKYKSKGFELIAVSADEDKGVITGFLKDKGTKFPVGWDQGHALADCWKPAVMPTSYIIDKKGIVRHIHNKWETGDEKKVEEQLKALL